MAEGALDVIVQFAEAHLADIDHDRARFDLRQIENVVDQREQVVAGRMNRLGELDLLRRQVAFGVLRRADRTRISKLLSGVRNSCDMFARNSDLYFEVSASCLAFSSSAWRACSTSVVLAFDFRVLLGQQLGFFLQLLVGLLQFFLPALQAPCASDCDCLSRSSVRMFASIVLSTMPMRFHELIEERLVRRAEPFERRQLHDRLHLAFEQHRQHDDVRAACAAQPGSDLHVIGRHIREQDRSLLQRALADQPFAQLEPVADVLAVPVGIARQQLSRLDLSAAFVGRIHDVEHAMLRGDDRRQFGQDQCDRP